MNDLEEAFSQINSFSFLLDELQKAIDTGDNQRVIDTTAALKAFYAPYCNNWDEKFRKAWEVLGTQEHLKNQPKGEQNDLD